MTLPDLTIDGVFDAAVSTFDGLNYLTPEELSTTVAAVARLLRPGGWLVFDIHTDAMMRFTIANAFPPGGLSHDAAVEDAYRADRLNVHRTTTRLGNEFLSEQTRVQRVLARLDRLPVPTYVLHGSDDPIVPVAASATLEGKGNVTRRVYPGLVHEMHNEPQSAEVISDTVAWLDAQLG
jgi:alpha-beta hydrolase superfamily lysophospholipase